MTRPDPLPDIWYTCDLRVLHEVARRAQAGNESLDAGDVADSLGMERVTVEQAGNRLEEDGYLAGGTTASGYGIIRFSLVTPKGRREVGQWPSPEVAADRLLAAMQAAVDQTPEGPEKTKKRRALEAVGAAGRDFVIQLGAAVVSAQIR